MKKFFYNIPIILLLLSLWSCSDLLDEKVYTQVTSDYIVSTPAGMSSAVLAMYSKDREIFRNSGDTETSVWMNILLGDDITVPRAGSGVPQFGRYENLQPSTSTVGKVWKQMYAMVGYANLVIEASNKVDMTDPVAIQALAEAKAFRAHANFWLIRKYDRIYLNTRVTTPENVNDSIVYTPADPQDVFKLINEDLNYAINNLKWETSQLGRFTQGVARHIKAKVAAWQKNWKEVANQVNAIEESGQYQLLVNPADVFNSADLNHSESIFVSQWSKETGGWYVRTDIGSTSGHRMPLHFTPQYNLEAGMQIDFASGAYPWGRLFPNNYLLEMYDQSKDKRYTAYYKTTWNYNNPDNLPRGKKFGDPVVPVNAAQYLNFHPACTKFNDSYTRNTPTETESFKDIIIYRLPETYLMGAEAYYHLNRPDSTAYYYNKTWVRAGNTAVSNGSVTFDMIADEHARELAMEGDRWFFLKRNDMLISSVMQHGGEYYVDDKGRVLSDNIAIRTNIQPHHVRWPIPQAQIDIMGKENFPQNENYD